MASLAEHIERHLGSIMHGWSKGSNGIEMPFQVVACNSGLTKGVTAYVTLGLSKSSLNSPNSGKAIRLEMLMLSRPGPDAARVPAILQQIGLEAIQRGKAYLRGDVIGPRGALFGKGLLEAVYVTMPVYYPESLNTYIGPDGDATIIAWLVPITKAEAEYVHTHGWSDFEDLLQRDDPDLLDFARPSLV